MCRQSGVVVVCLSISMALEACSHPSSPEAVQQAIGPSGGTVADSLGDSISFPANALGHPTPITLAAAPSAPLSSGVIAVGVPVLLGPEGSHFAQPVTVTLAFDPALLPVGTSAANVVILTAPAGSTDFINIGGTLVDPTHVAAPTTHFSIFVPAIAPPAPTTGGSTGVSGSAAGTSGSTAQASVASVASGSTGSATSVVPTSNAAVNSSAAATTSRAMSGSSAPTGVSSSTSSGSTSADPCQACSTAAQATGGACESESAACGSDPTCAALLNCFEGCAVDDYSCADACAQRFSSALNAYNSIGTCLCGAACASACAPECAGPGTTGTTGSTGGSDSCETCTAGAAQPGSPCTSAIEACTNDAACTTFTNCLEACAPGDDACANACASTSPAGANEYAGMVSCLCQVECPSECASECGSSPTSGATGGTAGSTGGEGTAGTTGGTRSTSGTTGSSSGTFLGSGTMGATGGSGSAGSTPPVCSELPFVANGDIGSACDPDGGSGCAPGEGCFTVDGISFCSRDCSQDGACPGGICVGYDSQGDALCFPDCEGGLCPQAGAMGCYALTPNPQEPGVCFPGCTSDSACNGDGGTAFTCTSGACLCTLDSDCGGPARCDPATGACYLPCTGPSDGTCASEGAGCCAEVADGGLDYCDFGAWPPSPSSGGPTGGSGSDGCEDCAAAAESIGGACASAVSACNSQPTCASLVACLTACNPGDTSCADTCASTGSQGLEGFDAVGICLCGAPACGTACAAECAGPTPP